MSKSSQDVDDIFATDIIDAFRPALMRSAQTIVPTPDAKIDGETSPPRRLTRWLLYAYFSADS